MHVTSGDDAPIMCDKYSTPTLSPKTEQLPNQFDVAKYKINDSSCEKFNESDCGYHEGKTNSSHFKGSILEDKHTHSNKIGPYENNHECAKASTENADSLQSPGKFWSVVSRTESPQGEIKLCINRRKKRLVS